MEIIEGSFCCEAMEKRGIACIRNDRISFYNMIVCPGSNQIHRHIQHSEHKKTAHIDCNKQLQVGQTEQLKQLAR